MFLLPWSIISTEKDFGVCKVHFVLKSKLHEKYITSTTKKSSGVPFSYIYITILNLTEK
jgi:hypothetical protein